MPHRSRHGAHRNCIAVEVQERDPLLAGDDATSRAAVRQLRPYWWVADFDPLRRAYERERDRTRRKRLARAYRELTGDTIWNGPNRFIEYGGPDRLLED